MCIISLGHKSDHNLIFAVGRNGVPRQSPRFVETRNFKKFNVNAFLTDLRNCQWQHIGFNSSNINEAWHNWKFSFLAIFLNLHAPKRLLKYEISQPGIKKEMFTRDSLKYCKKKSHKICVVQKMIDLL